MPLEEVVVSNIHVVKALGSVNHRNVLTRIKRYDIAASVINWVESFNAMTYAICYMQQRYI